MKNNRSNFQLLIVFILFSFSSNASNLISVKNKSLLNFDITDSRVMLAKRIIQDKSIEQYKIIQVNLGVEHIQNGKVVFSISDESFQRTKLISRFVELSEDGKYK